MDSFTLRFVVFVAFCFLQFFSAESQNLGKENKKYNFEQNLSSSQYSWGDNLEDGQLGILQNISHFGETAVEVEDRNSQKGRSSKSKRHLLKFPKFPHSLTWNGTYFPGIGKKIGNSENRNSHNGNSENGNSRNGNLENGNSRNGNSGNGIFKDSKWKSKRRKAESGPNRVVMKPSPQVLGNTSIKDGQFGHHQYKNHNNNANDVIRNWRENEIDVSKRVDDEEFPNWSSWSRCSHKCKQTRRKRCKHPSECGSGMIQEKRVCSGGRCKHQRFQFMKLSKVFPDFDKFRGRLSPRSNTRVLLKYNAMFYTKWSEWASCSHTCLTHRYRTCRYHLFCADAVIREEAYCYVPKSPCDAWYRRHKNGFLADNFILQSNRSSLNDYLTHKQPHSNIFHNRGKNTHRLSSTSSVQRPSSYQRNHRLSKPFSSSIRHTSNARNERWKSVSSFGNSFKTDTNGRQTLFNPHQMQFHKQNNYGKISTSDYAFDAMGNRTALGAPKTRSHFGKDWHKHFLRMPKIYQSNLKNSERIKSTPSSLAVGLPSVLPEKCGVGRSKKPSWSFRILGGREAEPDKWPWQVAILNKYKEVFCGGTVIAPQWILTAAHCLRKRLYVRLAEHDVTRKEGSEIEFRITEAIPHPLYNPDTVDNDVALVRVPRPLDMNEGVFFACVPEQGTSTPVGEECTIIGWGKKTNSNVHGTDILNEAEIPVVSREKCRRVYSDYYISQNMFCAGHRGGRSDSCAGDSGGPLLCHNRGLWYIHGITSFGEGCGKKGKYGIYAKVSNYNNWIKEVIGAHSHRNSKNWASRGP